MRESSLSFSARKATFEALCRRFDLSAPKIRQALPTDPCDYTSMREVRLNLQAAKGCTPDYHVRHVFGHWLCNLGEGAESDKVADLIAALITTR